MKRIVQTGFIAVAIALFHDVSAQVKSQPDGSSVTFELKESAVYYVQGKKPFKYRDNNFNLKESKTAYLVTFTFAAEPKIRNSRVDFYIGDYRIPEYGALEKGIYFRIYDLKLLESLNGQTISYQVANAKRVSFDRKFVIPNLSEMKIVDEDTIIKRKPK